MDRTYAHMLKRGSQVATNLAPMGALCTPCEIQPIHERQIRPLTVLEPDQQRDVWEEAVRTAPAGKVCHFRTPAILVNGGQTKPQKPRRCRPAWVAGGVALGPWRRRGAVGLGLADPWPRSRVTPAPLSLGGVRLRAVAGL
jgi:hypothetical protein